MAAGWLADRRTEVAADRILDAAGELFAGRDVAGVGMGEIASAAGCSRATLYRYFDSRDALYAGYVHREGQRLFRRIGEEIAGITDPHDRLVEGFATTLRLVRENPALASWFDPARRPIGGDWAANSEVIAALAEAFVTSLGSGGRAGDDHDVERRAGWLVRVLVSMLVFPGRDDAEERALVAEFVAPLVAIPAPS
jgi:AcrR family transcriptional regulator